MKAQSIPAQITTVEDKIAGNLNLTQIILLMIPVFWFAIVYTVFIPSMQFSLYKLPVFLIIAIISLTLSIRVKDKIILHLLVTILRYNLRPKYYLFNKNDEYLRTMDVISVNKTKRKTTLKSIAKKIQPVSSKPISFGDLVRLEGLLADPKYTLSIKSQKKGGFYVAFEQKQ